MKIEKTIIRDIIEKTLKEGGTLNSKGKVKNFKSGYMVGITKIIDKALNNKEQNIYSLNEVQEMLKYFQEKNKKDTFIGFWKEDNKIYIDIVINIKNKERAIKVAKEGKEIAIWDNKNKTEIIV